MKIRNKIRQHLIGKLPTGLLVLTVLLLLAAGYHLSLWWKAQQLNRAYDNKSILKQPIKNDEYLKAYSVGYLLAILRKCH